MCMKIFIDIDETVVHSVPCIDLWGKAPKGYETLKSPKGHGYASMLRPHAKEFIKELQELGDVAFLTAGVTSFQEVVLETHGIKGIPIYGRDTLGTKKFDGDFILIDDKDDRDMNMFNKLKTTGAIPESQSMFSIAGPERAKKAYQEHVVHAPAFLGNKNDDVLPDLLDEVKRRLNEKSHQ